MAGQECHLISQRQYLVGDRLEQRLLAAVGKIRPTDRTLEQHIAHQRERLLLEIQHHRTR